jgi:hypothetical protein
VRRQAREVQARNAGEEVLRPLLAELPPRRREKIIAAVAELHEALRKRCVGQGCSLSCTSSSSRERNSLRIGDALVLL